MKSPAITETIVSVDLGSEAEARYLNYALSVITSRALPDVRDGLKPVQRRLLFAMYQNLHLSAEAKPRKSAAVVGEVLGKYHPHGDQAAYEALVRLAQPFSLRYPLIHGEGNFGSIDGDSAAAMRYTEVKLTPLAQELFRGLRDVTVPFRPNYDATLEEPVVLPAAIPQLLMNGSTGIAVGLATNIPPHNLSEVIDALVALIDDPEVATQGLLKYIKGPDFPTAGEILTTKRELRQIYETGQGTLRLRGRWQVEPLPRGKQQIVITSLPYTVNKAQLVEKVAELVGNRKLPQVVDVRDESTEEVRIALELKADTSAELVMAYLFRHTSLQISFPVNLTCLVPTANPLVGQPARITLKEMCRHFLDFRMEVVSKQLEHQLQELENRLHILKGLELIANRLDQVIRLIRSAAARKEAREKLIESFQLDEVQAEAILETRLYQLARLELDKVEEEQADKEKQAKELRQLLADSQKRWRLIREELLALKQHYGDRRRTSLTAGEELSYDPEAYIVHEEATVILSRDGWIKRVRELKDPTSTRLREGDAIRAILSGTTRDRLALFTNYGGLYVMKTYDVPASTGYGEPIQTILHFQDGEQVVSAKLVAEPLQQGNGKANGQANGKDQGNLFSPPPEPPVEETTGSTSSLPAHLLATARGLGFRFRPNFAETNRSGRKVAKVAKGDEIVSIEPITGALAVCVTARGRIITFPTEEIAELSGPGRGVILMRLDRDDRLIGAVTAAPGTGVTVVDTEGNEREVPLGKISSGQRAGKGQRVMKRITLTGVRNKVAVGGLNNYGNA
jgi:DNA gyrase subunit A